MSSAFVVFGVPILAVIIVARQFHNLDKLTTPQRMKFSTLELLLPLLAFGAFMVSISLKLEQTQTDQSARILSWAVYFFYRLRGHVFDLSELFSAHGAPRQSSRPAGNYRAWGVLQSGDRAGRVAGVDSLDHRERQGRLSVLSQRDATRVAETGSFRNTAASRVLFP